MVAICKALVKQSPYETVGTSLRDCVPTFQILDYAHSSLMLLLQQFHVWNANKIVFGACDRCPLVRLWVWWNLFYQDYYKIHSLLIGAKLNSSIYILRLTSDKGVFIELLLLCLGHLQDYIYQSGHNSIGVWCCNFINLFSLKDLFCQ